MIDPHVRRKSDTKGTGDRMVFVEKVEKQLEDAEDRIVKERTQGETECAQLRGQLTSLRQKHQKEIDDVEAKFQADCEKLVAKATKDTRRMLVRYASPSNRLIAPSEMLVFSILQC